MRFLFQSIVTPKPYNNQYYWVDGKIIPQTIIEAPSLKEALNKYVWFACEHGIDIFEPVIKRANPMYIDLPDGEAKQTGYVITGYLDVYSDYTPKTYTCDIWVTIQKVEYPDFEEEIK